MDIQYHTINISSEQYQTIENGITYFQTKKNNKIFNINDIILLNEYVEEKYTGRQMIAEISNIYDTPELNKANYIVMELANVKEIN